MCQVHALGHVCYVVQPRRFVPFINCVAADEPCARVLQKNHNLLRLLLYHAMCSGNDPVNVNVHTHVYTLHNMNKIQYLYREIWYRLVVRPTHTLEFFYRAVATFACRFSFSCFFVFFLGGQVRQRAARGLRPWVRASGVLRYGRGEHSRCHRLSAVARKCRVLIFLLCCGCGSFIIFVGMTNTKFLFFLSFSWRLFRLWFDCASAWFGSDDIFLLTTSLEKKKIKLQIMRTRRD